MDVYAAEHHAVDHAGMLVLTFDECLALMRSAPVGRVAFAAAGEVEVLPVNHVVDGTAVAFRAAVGSKLTAAVENRPLTFEVDGYDVQARDGWSVVAKGTAEVVTDAAALSRLDAFGLRPWVAGAERPHWIRLRLDTVTGRRLPPR